MTTSEIRATPGYDSSNRAFLNVVRRNRENPRNLDFTETLLAHYKLFVTDEGEVMLVGGEDGDEVLFSEILDTETRMDYDTARCDAGLI
jgi:hypothetical protein